MMKNRKLFSIALFIFVALLPVLAQNNKVLVRGTVIDALDNSPLPFVNIMEMDADNRFVSGTQTDMNGQFSMYVSSRQGTKLVFTFIGFEKQVLPVDAKKEMRVVMREESKMLADATVTASRIVNDGMMNVKERNMTVAYTKIETKELEELQVASIDDALQGRIAGVDIVATSGEPGAGMSIRIRGTTSINASSDPLIVVDGIPYETTIDADFDFATADEEEYAALLNVSPADIEEIVVLKDAAATAIWGSQGANGVLQIKTKRGSIGSPKITYTFKGTGVFPQESIPTLNGDQYTTLIMEAKQNTAEAGIANVMNPASFPEFYYDPKNPYYYYNYGQNTDWADLVQKNSFTQDHNLSLSGGGEKARYRMSLGYLDQGGTVIGQNYNRITARMNLDYYVSDKIKVLTDIAYTYGDNARNYTTSVLSSAYTKMPNMSLYEWTLDGQMMPSYFSPEETPQGSWSKVYNPVAMAEHGKQRLFSERIVPKLTMQYYIIPNQLTYQIDLAFDINNTKTNKFLPQIATGRPMYETSVNQAYDSDSKSFTVQTYNKLIYTPTLGDDHDLTAMLAFNTRDARSESMNVTTANSASTSLTDPSIPSKLNGNNALGIASSFSQTRSFAAMFSLNYALKDRYIFGTTVRSEGNSKFGANYRYGVFPSISGRWRLSAEEFMGNWEFLDDLSLRASYGVNGNAVSGNYLSYSMYNTYAYQYMGMTGVSASNMELQNLRWEKVHQYNGGFKFAAFKNRINIDFDIYRKRTEDLYFKNVTIPSSSGYDKIAMNVGTMDNQGWELSVLTTPVKTKKWTMEMNMNVARSVNIIRDLSPYIAMESGVTTSNGNYLSVINIGQPLGSFYGYRYAGVYLNEDETIARDANGNKIYDVDGNPVYMRFGYPTIDYQFEPGDAKYEDINHDGNINYLDIVYLGDANPLFTGGFGPTIRYNRQWTLSAYFYFRVGNEVVNKTKMDMESMYNMNNQSTSVLRRWRHSYDNPEEAPADLLPRALFGYGYNWLGSDRYVEDGSFLRWKSLTLSYNFNKEKLKSIGLSDLKIHLTAQNIMVWTNYTGMDPEVSIGGSNIYLVGYDQTRAPKAKDVSLGMTIGF